MAKDKADALTLMEAVDNLSSLAEIENDDTSLGQEGKSEDLEIHLVKWLDPAKADENRATIKETFKVLNSYLHHIYEKEEGHLQDVDMQKGIQAIMVLAGEAVQKVDTLTGLFKGAHGQDSITELSEYKDLQRFYLTKIMKRFQEVLETQEAWEKEWGGVEDTTLGIQRKGLKDLETVRRDKEYELFYIKKEDNNPFFNRNLLRHIRLLGDFDEAVLDTLGDDPFLKSKILQDKDVHITAKEILKLSLVYIDDFYKEALRHKELEFVTLLNKALMALMLTANPRNLRENTTQKSCISYFRDFHVFLRMALRSFEYARYLSYSVDKQVDRFSHSLINLSHSLCCLLFTRLVSRKDAVEFIHRLINKVESKSGAKKGADSRPFWNILLDDDESIRNLLKRYPNGPLLKTLDAFREDEQKGFDPILQDNLPSQLFSFNYDSKEITVLRIPSPTRQEIIDKAEVIEEFGGFLRYLNTRIEGEKHLLFNLQDRTSWQEHARSTVLEKMQKLAEFSSSLTVITLPKNTDFYHQTGAYLDLNNAKLFMETFKEQLKSAEECGFYFPSSLKSKDILEFCDEAFKLIHTDFFSTKETLSRKNRLDFIESFYLLLEMKLIEIYRPDSISFTCKDAVDAGASASVSFFSFLKMLNKNSEWTEEDKDFILWMLYAPALLIRERAIDPQNFNRTISLLAHLSIEIETKKKKILQGLDTLYHKPLFDTLNLLIA